MKYAMLSCTGILLSQLLVAQIAQLDIEQCQQKARDNYPLIKQYGLLEQSERYNLANLTKSYLPQISLNGQASYQTDVVQIPIKLPMLDIPSMAKDQYKATIDVNQLVWDGGAIRAQQKITRHGKEVEQQSTTVSLYQIRERVNQLYFGILMINEQLNQLHILQADLENSRNTVLAFVQNGTATSPDVDVVQVETLHAEQQQTELETLRKSYLQMLSALTHEQITSATVLQKPEDDIVDPLTEIRRPELSLYEKQRHLSEAQELMISAGNLPKISLFLQGGYGKPGLNMLSDKFDLFGIGGVRFTWNFGRLYTAQHEKQLLVVQKNTIDTRQKTFLFNTRLQLMQVYNDVLKSKQLIQKDEEILLLRHRIKKAAESKYENGIYTINDLLKDIHAENQSRQTKILHEIQYMMNTYNYKYIAGN